MVQGRGVSAGVALSLVIGLEVATSAGAADPARMSVDSVWTSADAAVEALSQNASLQTWVQPLAFKAFQTDHAALDDALRAAPMEFSPEAEASPAEIALPMPDGGFARFRFVESPILAPELGAQFPEIKTYLGQGIDDPSAVVRFDRTPTGFHAQVLSPSGTVFIDPYLRNDATLHVSYFKRDYPRPVDGWECLTDADPDAVAMTAIEEGEDYLRVVGENLRTYRLACAATGEYTVFHGGTVPLGLAAVTTAVNRVSGLYELETSVRLTLVGTNNLIIYTNGATDPYTNNDGIAMLTQNQSNLTTVIGSANYDIGHVFSTGGGGVASLGVVCAAASKARGVTGSPQPAGDPFFVDYVIHEMGHQFNATHSFNGANGNCSGGNRTASTAYEPGSGSTIMGYAGICGADNLQTNSDAYFHSANLTQIINFTATGGGSACDAVTATGNLPPTVNAGPNYNIPQSTPFTLVATGSDPNGDRVTFCWEQRDLGPQASLATADQGTIPLFRSFDPTRNPVRTIPRFAELLNNTFPVGERFATTNRTLNFRCTVRDQRGGTASDDMQATVSAAAGPFAVTAPNTAVTWSTSPQTVTWNVASTNAAPINAANVNIKLITDSGLTPPITLLSNTPNDGSESVVVPAMATTTARIVVEAASNIFFDISNANFTISQPVQFSLFGSPSVNDSAPNGNNNSAADPGESNLALSIAIQNAGPTTATGISGSLISLTPTATVVSGVSAYPNLVALGGNSPNITPYILALDAGHVCGTPVNLRLSVTCAQGARYLDVVLPTGEGAPMIFSYNSITGSDLPVSIPDAAGPVNIPITVSGVGTIADIDFRFDGTVCSATAGSATVGLTHSWVGDVTSTLISPSGKAVPLTMRPGGGGLGSNGNNFCQTLFNDDGIFPSIQTIAPNGVGAPYTSTWKSAWPLSDFDGENGNGVWTLRIVDTSTGDLGTLRAFSLIITPRTCAPPAVPVEACCFANGSCADIPFGDCTHSSGVPQGVGSACSGDSNGNSIDDLCEVPGACCLAGGVCSSLKSSQCDAQGGEFQGEGADCDPNPCACPALLSAVSRKCSPACDLAFESRQGGISQVVFNYSAPPLNVPAPTVESDCTCPSPPAFGPIAATPTCAPSGNALICDFAPALTGPCAYRFTACSGTGTASVVIRALVGDVNDDGFVNSLDRSVVVGAWTGPGGYTCATDLDCNGQTNALDRSIVVGSWTGGQNCAP